MNAIKYAKKHSHPNRKGYLMSRYMTPRESMLVGARRHLATARQCRERGHHVAALHYLNKARAERCAWLFDLMLHASGGSIPIYPVYVRPTFRIPSPETR